MAKDDPVDELEPFEELELEIEDEEDEQAAPETPPSVAPGPTYERGPGGKLIVQNG